METGTRPKPSKRVIRSRPGRWKEDLLRIQAALSLDLLGASYRHDKTWVEGSRLKTACLGHCYVATEAAYHLFARKAGYVPYYCKNPGGTTHWWLVHPVTNEILDPSEPQLSEPYPYDEGRRQRFRTTQPSKRARELMRRVRAAARGLY